MTTYKMLAGAKCYLSPCRLEDAEHWAEWFNDLEVTIPLGDEAYTPTSLEGEQEAIRGILKNNSHIFSIVDLETDQTIGRCLLFNIDAVNRTAMLGIEFMGAAQALDFRDLTPGRGVQAARTVIRQYVEHLDEDRPLYPDHNRMQALVKSCEILEAVESVVGSLD